MLKIEFKERTGYFNIDMKICMNDFLITVFYMTLEKGSPTWKIIENTNVFYGLHYVLYGKGILKTGNNTFNLVPGTFYFTHPQIQYNMTSNKNEPMGEAYIYFDFKKIKGKEYRRENSFMSEEIDELSTCFMDRAMKVGLDECDSGTVINKIRLELETQHKGVYTKLHSLFGEIFINAWRSFSCDKNTHYPLPEIDKNEKRKIIIEWGFENNYKTLTREQLAKELNVGIRQLDRLIREYYSLTFNEKLLASRIYMAKELLTSSDLSISRIAEEVGLQHSTYFITVFKKHEGITPNKYRRMAKEKKD